MKEFIDKLIERLEEKKDNCEHNQKVFESKRSLRLATICEAKAEVYNDAITIVNELAEEYGKKNTYEITLEGCDDCTIFTMDLTIQEYEFLVSVSELANKTSFYGCMPRMYVSAEGE